MDEQPGFSLPEQIPISKICVLSDARPEEEPGLQRLPSILAVQAYLGHTAGTRLFSADLLAKHLSFCSQAAGQVPVFQLTYPHLREALPIVKRLLENLC